MSFSVCNDTTAYCYTSASTAPQSHRVTLGSVVQGDPWTVEIVATTLPASDDPNYYYNEQKRKMYAVVYWEDEDRDDSDGPDAGVQ